MNLNKLSSKLFVFVVIIGLAGACSNHSKKDKTQPKHSNDRSSEINYTTPLAFVSSGDTLVTIKVSIAKTETERDEGLMDVHHMAENKGMLFIFDQEQPLSFWMVNTPLPLDIIFVNKQHQIVRIHHSTKPFSRKSLPSGKPAKYAVETNGGFCVTHDIREGMKIIFKK